MSGPTRQDSTGNEINLTGTDNQANSGNIVLSTVLNCVVHVLGISFD